MPLSASSGEFSVVVPPGSRIDTGLPCTYAYRFAPSQSPIGSALVHLPNHGA
jgi:hypothetical protein